jgi:hypothetical protein
LKDDHALIRNTVQRSDPVIACLQDFVPNFEIEGDMCGVCPRDLRITRNGKSREDAR